MFNFDKYPENRLGTDSEKALADSIRHEIQRRYDCILQQIENGTWERLSTKHIEALRDACNRELLKRKEKENEVGQNRL